MWQVQVAVGLLLTFQAAVGVGPTCPEAIFGDWNPAGWDSPLCLSPGSSSSPETPELPRCNIPRISIQDLDPQTTVWQQIPDPDSPVILTGLQIDSETKAKFSRSQILRDLGSTTVTVGNAESLYLGKTHPRHWKMTVKEYIEAVDELALHPELPKVYLFEWSDQLPENIANLLQEVEIPETLGFGLENDPRILALGGAGGGVPFHLHGKAWNLLIFGRKRWFLSPGSKTPAGGYNELKDQATWASETYPKLTEKQLENIYECVQEPGEIVLVPDGWYHATVSCGQSIAVAALIPDTSAGIGKALMKRDSYVALLADASSLPLDDPLRLAESMSKLRSARKLVPKNDLVVFSLCYRLALGKQYAEARKCYLESLKLNPQRADAYRQMAMTSFKTGNFEVALDDLKKAFKLCPDYATETCIRIAFMLEDLLNKLGDKTEALKYARKKEHWLSAFHRDPGSGPQSGYKKFFEDLLTEF